MDTGWPRLQLWEGSVSPLAGDESPARAVQRVRPLGVQKLFVFPNDMLPVKAEPNRLNDQVLVRYYEHDWREIAR